MSTCIVHSHNPPLCCCNVHYPVYIWLLNRMIFEWKSFSTYRFLYSICAWHRYSHSTALFHGKLNLCWHFHLLYDLYNPENKLETVWKRLKSNKATHYEIFMYSTEFISRPENNVNQILWFIYEFFESKRLNFDHFRSKLIIFT